MKTRRILIAGFCHVVAALALLLASVVPASYAGDPNTGPGGPILVITSTSTYGNYYAEILRTEGLNQFAVSALGQVTAATLSSYDVAILAPTGLTPAQATMFSDWVNSGGNLIAMRPDSQLASLIGISPTGTTLSNAYLRVDTSTQAGNGVVSQAMQFHGIADRYSLSGATSVATLYTNASTATSNPAVTLRSVGANGGHAAAFAYDLATSIVYTRQGNPAWAAQERDGVSPIRSDDKFYGDAAGDPQPDWVDLDNLVSVPQADEQQRLLANLILRMNLAKKPLPRFWYFPNGKKAVVIMTGDDHANGGTPGRFDLEIAASPAGCNVANWECVRSTSYIYDEPINLTDAQAASYTALGFEVGVHINTDCADFTSSSLETFYSQQIASFSSLYPSIPAPVTQRHHCIAWSDWVTGARTQLAYGIRLDTDYYFWPPGWTQNRPGHFTGSAMPMRFADLDGTLIDVYGAPTQMTDESGQSYPYTSDALLSAAVGPQGYYGVYTVNAHTDTASSPVWDGVISSAQARGVPVVSSAQMLKWLDARNDSSFAGHSWNGSTLSFSIAVASGANGLRAMLPAQSSNGVLASINGPGGNVTFTVETIKGVDYAFFPASAGLYSASYLSDTTPPTITSTSPLNGATGVSQSATVNVVFSEAMDSATLNSTSFVLRDAGNAVVPATVSYVGATRTAVLTPSAPLAYSASYTATLTTAAKDLAGNPLSSTATWSFTTAAGPPCPCTAWSSSTTPSNPSVSDPNAVELGVKFRVDLNGYITGLRFYKGAGNTGTHVGSLWSSAGQLLSSATFTNETATGWQQVSFPTPVLVTANTVYVASYHTTVGNYAADGGYFTNTGVDNYPVHLLQDGVSGGNGVYAYSASSTFPADTFQASNYWVDVVFTTSVGPIPLSVSSTSPANGATNVSAASVVSATFNNAIDGATINASTFQLRDPSNALVTGTYSVAGNTATLTPSSPLAAATTYTATLSTGVKDTNGGVLNSAYTWSFTTGAPQCTNNCTLWQSTVVPGTVDGGPDSAVELGLRFRADVDGSITGIRFYKASTNTGVHVGNLWSAGGQLLATATFSNETASGWQQVNFSTPVPITANTAYVASYHLNAGHYSADQNYFAANGVDTPPLHAFQNGVSGLNGLYAYGAGSSFPTQSWNASNYWVDVVFTTVSVSSIAVTPASPTIQTGNTQQFIATATYSDNSTADVTSQAQWTSSNTGVATINSAGLATGVSAGSSNISATLGGATGGATLTVQTPLAITTSVLANGAVGVAYSATLAASGGTAPYTWSLSTGSLPGGLSLNPTTGAITGVPTASGAFSFTARVTDSAAPAAVITKNLSITVPAPLVISTSTLANGQLGAAYTAALAATGGITPYAWSVTSGSLPGGLTLGATTGSITGTPTAGGIFNFTVQVADASAPVVTTNKSLSITILAPLAITNSSLPNGAAGVGYSANLTATGGTAPYTSWSVISGTLPTGLTLSATTGAITGTPVANGTFNFTVQVSDSANPVATTSKALGITIGQPVTTTSFLVPSANAPVTTSAGDNNGFQTTPANGYVTDGAFAVDTNSGTGTSTSCTNAGKDKHDFFNYNLTLPNGVPINGIEVRLDARVSSTSSAPRMCVQLSWNGGASWTTAKTTPNLTTSTATYTLGGSADNWGRAWAATELANSTFRLRIINIASSTSRTFSLDGLAVRVNYGDGTAPTVTAFTIPASSSSLNVPITTFTATDTAGVTGYLVTESPTAPLANDAGWLPNAPSSYTFATIGTKTLYAWAKDAAGNVSTSRSATVTITAGDSTAPVVTAFTVPATSSTLTIPITSFTATDAIGVTGYLVTEVATAPLPGATGWTATAPTSYTVASAGAKTLYAWAKDAAGNVSTSLSAPVTVTISTSFPEAAGWFSGDMHVHRSCGSSPEAIASLYDKMTPNNLSVISLLADSGNAEVQNAITDLPLVNGQDASVSTPGRIVHWDTEWHWDPTYLQYPHQVLGGHIVNLGLTSAQQTFDEYTYPVLNATRQQGGVAGFAHMQYLDGGIPQSLSCCTPIEYPVEVGLGAADFISEDVDDSTSGFSMNPDAFIDAYYKLLNTGFRPGFAAGTDYPCNSSRPLGSLLTYVQVAGGQMTYRNWIDGIKAGRTVVSRNGHKEFLSLTVNGTATPGDEIQLASAGSVPVTVQWTATENIAGPLELVSNGVVVATTQASVTPGAPVVWNTTVNFPKSGWVVARRMGGDGHEVHTAAVFVIVNGAPIRVSASDAQYYVAWMDNLLTKTSPGGPWNQYFANSLSQAQARYQAAKAVFQQRAADAGGGTPPGQSGSIFTTQIPNLFENDSPYELGTRFYADVNGQITQVRLYTNALEGGNHTVRIWQANTSTVVAGPYTWNITAGTEGWKTFTLPTPLSITANTDYIVAISNSSDQWYAQAVQGFGSPIVNGNLHTYVGSGTYSTTSGGMPTSTWQNTNYFRDVVFAPQ